MTDIEADNILRRIFANSIFDVVWNDEEFEQFKKQECELYILIIDSIKQRDS